MSINQMKKAFEDNTLTPIQKLIMLSLADNANDSGVCFPSWNLIQEKTGLSRGAVASNIKKLVEEKKLLQKHRNRKNGSRTSSKYLLFPIVNMEILDEEDLIIFQNITAQSSSDVLSKTSIQSSADVPTPNTQSSADVPPEPSLIFKPSLTSNNKLVMQLIKEKIIQQEMGVFLSEDFIKYRKQIKKPIKTIQPLKAYLNVLKELITKKVDISKAIELMKEKEWQTLKAEYLPKDFWSNAITTNEEVDYLSASSRFIQPKSYKGFE